MARGQGSSRLLGRNGLLLFMAVLIPAAVAEGAQPAKGTVEVLGELKGFRDGVVRLFEKAAENLNAKGMEKAAGDVAEWSNDWLSVLGINKGLTGLAKDYVLNYLGRPAYHEFNGPLIEKIRNCGWALAGKTVDDASFKNLRNSLLEVSEEGKKLFKEEGGIHQMLSGLNAIVGDNETVEHFKAPLMEDPEIKSAFYFLSGERLPVSSDEANVEEL